MWVRFFVAAAHCAAIAVLPLSPDMAFAAAQENGQPCPPECVTDSMEIVTWYPSPYNEYEELRLYPTQRDDNYCDNDKMGLMYYDDGGTPSFPEDDKMRVCKGIALGWQEVGGEGFWKSVTGNTNDIYYTQSGNVGIGTDTPEAKVHIKESGGQIVTTFSYTGGQQTYVVPAGVTSVFIEAFGAAGGGSGGLGGKAVTTVNVTPGETLYVYVGGVGITTVGGYNGGGGGGSGNFSGYGGGGASDVRQGGIILGNRVIVAGGGGGAGGTTNDGNRYAGGAGGVGGFVGGDGGMGNGSPTQGLGGGGGTQSVGGSGASGGGSSGVGGSSGSGGGGGGGVSNGGGGGGGGGGYYGGGGGGGGGMDDTPDAGGAGGGGSSYVTGANSSTQAGVRYGNGSVVITIINNNTLYVEGVLTVDGIKNFEISHPAKPGMKLVHSSLEGPEAGVYYRGQARLDSGQAVITLPDYFEALTSPENRTVLFAPIDGWAPLYVEDGIKDGKFVVKSADSAKNEQKFFWEVKALRKDIPPLVVEKKE